MHRLGFLKESSERM